MIEKDPLPILKNDGFPVDHPECMLFAATLEVEVPKIKATYAAFCGEMNNNPKVLEGAEKGKSWVGEALTHRLEKGDFERRLHAGHVVLELYKNCLNTGKDIGLGKAYGLVAEQHLEEVGKPPQQLKNSVDTVRKAFSDYRPVSHILGVWAGWNQLFWESENDYEALEEVLRRAKTLELFLERYFEQRPPKKHVRLIGMPAILKPFPEDQFGIILDRDP